MKLETEIQLLKQSQEHSCKKIDEIHKILVGDGKKGLINEFNQLRGGLRYTQVTIGFLITVASLLIIWIK